jgi:hypothetical protein
MPGAMDKLSSVDAEVKELRQEVQKFSREVVSALAKLEQKVRVLLPTDSLVIMATHRVHVIVSLIIVYRALFSNGRFIFID